MTIFDKIKNIFENRTSKLKLENWYNVSWDHDKIYIDVKPPGKNAWNDSINWNEIERICFEATDLYESDCIYIFIKDQDSSYAIPTESNGGGELWLEIIERKLFDAKLAIQVASAPSGLFCWPPIEEK